MRHAHQGRYFSVLLRLGSVLLVLSPQQAKSQIAVQTAAGAQAGPDTGAIAAGRFRLRYRIEGAGTPAIVIGDTNFHPRVFSQNLRKHLRLVFLDDRSFAPSPGRVDTAEIAWDTLIDDVERARKELGLGRVAVIGHSGHGLIALEYAKKYPANVSHVIMIDTPPSFSAANAAAAERSWQELVSPERKAIMQENLERLPDEKIALLPPGKQFLTRLVRNEPRMYYNPRFDSSPLYEDAEVNMDVIKYAFGTVLPNIDITQGLAAFDRPVFLAFGHYDFLVAPLSAWDSIRPKFRDLTVRVFERSGHVPQYEEAGLFDSELLRWMKERP